MLAYVFWHQRDSRVPKNEYQDKLATFHQRLEERAPQGYLWSMVLEIASVPWMPTTSETYEDWYILENSAALDVLNEAAVTSTRRDPHQQVAQLASHGTGGLYRLHRGLDAMNPAQLAGIRSCAWFSKPEGMTYGVFYELLDQSHLHPHLLWQRQMTIGPALEFCLHNTQECALPDPVKALEVAVLPIFGVGGRTSYD